MRSLFGILCAMSVALGCGEESSAPLPDFAVHSEGVREGLLLSVLEHEGTVWTVGGRPGAAFVAKIEGDGLVPVKNPGKSTAWWVCPLGKEVAVVGDDGLILLQRGDKFELLDLGIPSTLYGCAGESLDDFWVVGGDVVRGPPELVHVVDGKGRAPDLGLDLPLLPKVFFKVARFGERLVVVGEDGAVLMADANERWSLDNVGEKAPMFTVSGNSAEDFWVVGGRVDGLVYRYDGKRFKDESPESAAALSGIAVSGNRVLAVGNRGLVLEREGDDWVELPPLTTDSLHAVWQDKTGRAWTVGGNLFQQSKSAWRGVVLER